MQNLVFYISGHGYGHATRSIELINALSQKSSHLRFHIKSDAPRWLFKSNLTADYALHGLKVDIGVVQPTCFQIDKSKTLAQWTRWLDTKASIVETEAAFIRDLDVKLILADIPPLAFDIAAKTAIPSVAIANFSWDWILSGYVPELPQFAPLVQEIEASYQKADRLLRLPFHGDLSGFRDRKDIPLIAGRAFKSKEEVRDILEIPREECRTLVLVAFRASDLAEVDVQKAFSGGDFMFVTLGLGNSYENSLDLPPDFIRFTELLNASDLVVSKPGYGLVSEIIAHQTPLLYTSRDDFAEYEVLVDGLQAYAVSQFIPRSDFMAGNWQPYLHSLTASDQQWQPIPVNGAEKASEEIVKIMKRSDTS